MVVRTLGVGIAPVRFRVARQKQYWIFLTHSTALKRRSVSTLKKPPPLSRSVEWFDKKKFICYI